jgi:hypothetical protein
VQPHPFRTAVEARDHAGMTATLTADVRLWSPISFRPFEGREAVSALLAILLETFEDFRYTDELAGEDVHGLVFRARIGDKEVEGLDLIREDADGQIVDLTVMVRPLSGAIALAEAVGAKLGAVKGGAAT